MNWLKKLVLKTFAPERLLSDKELKAQLAYWRKKFKVCNPLNAVAHRKITAGIRTKIDALKNECKRRGLPS